MSSVTNTTKPPYRTLRGLVAATSWAALTLLLGSSIDVQEATAYQVKRVVRGVCAMTNTQEVKTVDLIRDGGDCDGVLDEPGDNVLGGVVLDTTKTFVLITNSIGGNDINDRRRTNVTGLIDDSQTLLLTRFTSGNQSKVEYMVVEFVSGVTVVSGLTTIAETGSTALIKNIQLPQSFDPARSFPTVALRSFNSSTTTDERNVFTAQLTSSTNLRLERSEGGGAFNVDLAYQVIGFDLAEADTAKVDVAVQKSSVTLPPIIDGTLDATRGEASDTDTSLVVNITAVDPVKAFLWFSVMPGSAVNGDEESYAIDGVFSGCTTTCNQLTFTRIKGGGGQTVTIVWHVMAFKDVAYVQRSRSSVTTESDTPTNVTLSSAPALILGRSFVTRSVSLATSGAQTTSGLDDISIRAQLTSATNLALTRETTDPSSDNANVSWLAVQLPPLHLKTPNGDENLKVGDTVAITWDRSDDVAGDSVRLELSNNSGSSWMATAITCDGEGAGPTYPNDGLCNWTIPPALGATNVFGNQMRIRITDTNATNAPAPYNIDISNKDFEIKGLLTITAPVGGETWKVGETTRTVTWNNKGNFNGASITGTVYYSTAGSGGPWTAIPGGNGTCSGGAVALGTDAGSGGSNSCTWTPIPDVIGANTFVKIEVNYTGTYDSSPTSLTVSPAAFTIKGQLTVTAHDGGSPDWPTQTNQNVTWTKTGTQGAYTVLYSTNSGGAYLGTVASALAEGTYCTGNNCSYTWNVAIAAISDFVRLRVQSDQAANVQAVDDSAADFKIVPSLRITSPNIGSEIWKVGETTRSITWVMNGSIATVKLEYSTNAFADELQTTTILPSTGAVDGTELWPSIPDAIGDNVKVRISDTGAPAPPAAGARFDVSDNPFKIRGQISITAPNGTETNLNALRVNTAVMPSSFLITWTRQGAFGNVDIHYNATGCGTAYPGGNAIATNYSVGNNITWTIPDDITTTACVRVRANNALYQTDTLDESDANFHIKGAFDVTYPDGNEILPAGVNQTITWNKAGTMGNVKIEYATDGVTFNNTIIAATPSDTDPPTGTNNGQYGPWAPTTVASLYKIKLSLVGDEANVNNISGTTFEIKGSITNVTPNGNADPALTDYWLVGETNRNIGWTSTPPAQGNVKILYSLDAGGSFPDPGNLIATLASTASPYTWPSIPVAAIGESVRFRVHRELDPGVKDDTDNNIRIYNLAINTPNGAETGANSLRVGGSYLIQWTKSGAFNTPSANLKVLVSTDGTSFPDPANLIATVTGSNYNWPNIPASFRSNTVKIKVQWQGSTNVEKISSLVNIKPSVNLTAPDGGGPYGAGTLMPITFSHTGDGGDGWRLLYSTNGGDAGGGTYPNPANVITTVSGASPITHNWTMPTTLLSNNVRVKVELVGDETNVKDESVNAFEVKGSITNPAPAGNSDPALTDYWMVGETKNISWTSNPTSQNNVKVLYSLDGGTSFPEPAQLIATVDSAASPYSWGSIPAAAIGESVKFRIYRELDPSVKADTANNIRIYNLTVDAPTGTETGVNALRVGGNYLIQWTKSGAFSTPSANLKVLVSTDDGSNFPDPANLIATVTGSSYNWPNIPAAFRSNTVKFKVQWQGSTNVQKISPRVHIKPSVNLTAPDGGGPYGAGTTLPITFSHTGDSGSDSWRLLYSTNGGDAGGGTYPNPANVITALSGASPVTHNWSIPSSAAVLSNNVRIKVELVGDEANVKDESVSAFAIKGSITNPQPNGNSDPALTDYYMVGETKNISWTSNPASQNNVKVLYSLDGGTTFPEPANLLATVDSTASPYSWGSIPAAAIGESVRFRIYRELDPSVKADTANNIKIYNLVLDTPTANEVLRVGGNYLVQWTKSGAFSTPSANLKVLVSTDDGSTFPDPANLITTSTGSSFNWTSIPDSFRSNTVKFKVQWQGSTNVQVISPRVSIRPNVDLTTMNSGTFAIDDVPAITFTHTGRTGASGDTWRIRYSTDGGSSYPVGNIIHTTAVGPASPYTYNWTIPEVAGIVDNDIKIKVEMVGDETNVKDESTSNLTIRGKVTLSYPDAANILWKVAENRTITWTTKGLTNVRIDYTLNNGTDGYGNNIIASTSASAGSYPWNNIPAGAVSDQFKIRVKAADAADSVTEDISANILRVLPRLTLTYPTGGETLIVGTLSSSVDRTITWTYSGAIDFVEIYYTKDTTGDLDGDLIPDPPEVTWVGIATGASAVLPGALQYTWPSVPDDITSNARIVIRKKNDSTTRDIKGTFFKIRGDLRLDQPDASGLNMGIGTDYDIKWTPTGTLPANIKIEYSTNGFSDESQTATCIGPPPGNANGANVAPGATGMQQTFTWRIPNAPSAAVKVRVQQLTDISVTDKSTNNFAIIGSLFVDVPNGPATAWVPGDAESILWHKLGNISTIHIYYSKNNGTDGYPYVVQLNQAAGPESGSSLPWPGGVPNEATADTYRIKIIDTGNPNVFDVSDAGFIIKSRISGVTPGGSSPEYVGDPLTVAWTETGQPGPVTIQLSKNAFADETQNVTLTTAYTHGAQVQYVVPGGVPDALSETVKYRVKSEQANGALVASGLSASSHPLRGKITVNAMPTLILGDTASVSWSRSGTIGGVKVEYFDGTSWSTLTTTAAEAGPYGFTMSSPTINETATNLAQVRVSDADRPEVISTSAAFLVKPLIQVTSPTNNDARTYNVGQAITWNKKGGNVLNVRIEYFNGVSWADLFGGTTSNDGTESWVTPDNVSNLYNKQIRISSLPAVDPWAVTVVQNGNFKIVGTVAITAPIATDKWVAGATNNVKWSKTGTGLANIRLDYTTDNWNSSGTIVASYDATLGATGYPWPIPLTAVTDNAIIKISDANDASVTGFSAAGFKIVPGFTVQRPAVNERVKVGQNFQIQWDRNGTGTPNTVNLYYSVNGGGAWTPIASAQTNSGTYDWPVPDLTALPLANSLVKVEWTGDAGAFDESSLFKLVAGFTMVSPNSTADKWDVGTLNKPVTWTCTSANVPKAKLEYSTNGGTSYDFVIAAEADNTGASGATRTYLWPSVDNAITDQFRVRVSQPFVSGVQASDTDFANGAGDISDSNAKIKMYTQVLTPNASGIELLKGSSYNITWTTTGTGATTTNVKLFYSKDNFATAGIAIMDGALDYTPNDGTFLWTVADDIVTSATVKVRAQSWTDLDAKDESDNAFKIEGDYTISSPIINDPFKIYDVVQNPVTHPITWTTIGGAGGTMGTVNLIAYSTNPIDPYFRDGSNNVYTLANPLTIVNGLANTPNGATTYNWQVPDKATTTAVVRVVNPADTTVVKDSPTFKVQASLTLTAPNSLNLTLVVGDPYTVTWNRTGTSLARVKITLSKNGLTGPFNPILETFETANDGIVSNTGSFGWTVPNDLSPNCLLRIEDPVDSTVVSTTAVANAFRIRGGLTFVTPTATTPQTRWVTNESRIVSWNTTGSITAVNLVYTKNNFSTTTPIVSNYGNAVGLNTYPWTIPNDQSTTVKLRLIDANDPVIYSDSAQFTIDLYQITFEIRDLLSNSHISGLAVSGSNTQNGAYTWVASVASPVTKGLQAGGWNLTFTKSEYADVGTNFVSDSDKTIVLYAETKVVHIWESITDIAYNASNDTGTLSSTLRRDGITVTGATSCTINIYDVGTLIKTFAKAGGPDTAQGFYSFTWSPPTGLVTGKVYNMVTTIVNATGGNINTPSTFNVTEVKQLQSMQDTILAKLTTSTSDLQTDIQNTLNAQTGTITTKLDQQKAAIDTKLTDFQTKSDAQIALLSTEVTNVRTAAGDVQKQGESLEGTNLKFSGRLMMPRTVLINDKDVVLNYQAVPGLIPLLTITTVDQSGKEVTVVKNFPMSQNKDRADVYEYKIDRVTSPPYLPGKFVTVLVEAEVFKYKLQPAKAAEKNLEVGSFIVESTTLSTLEGLVAGQSGVKDVVVDTMAMMRALQASLGAGATSGNMVGLLQALSAKMDALPRQIAQEVAGREGTAQIHNTINEMAQQLRTLAGNDMGYDFSKLMGKALDESSSLRDLRKKADSVQGTTEVMQVLMEQKLGGVDTPVVHVIYQ